MDAKGAFQKIKTFNLGFKFNIIELTSLWNTDN